MLPTAEKETQELIRLTGIAPLYCPELPDSNCGPAFIQSHRGRYAFGVKPVAAPYLILAAKDTADSGHVEEKFTIPDRAVFGIEVSRFLEG